MTHINYSRAYTQRIPYPTTEKCVHPCLLLHYSLQQGSGLSLEAHKHMDGKINIHNEILFNGKEKWNHEIIIKI